MNEDVLDEYVLSVDLAQHNYMFSVPAYDGKICADTALALVTTSSQISKDAIPHEFLFIRGGALIDAVRNEIAHKFLKSDADTLICIDADIVFSFESMQRLMVFAHHYPIVCGAYTCKTDEPKFIVTPTEDKLNKHGLLPVDSLGFGFVAIQRKVFEDMIPYVDQYYDEGMNDQIHAFFRITVEDNKYMGEDIYFFTKAKEAGHQAYVDPLINLEHIGVKKYNTPFYRILDKIIKKD